MFCRNCGTNIPDGAAFCANCGEAVAQPAVATALSEPRPSLSLKPHVEGGADGNLLAMTKEHLGKDYRIDQELGRGGMAVVYKAVEIALERQVAIKVVPPDNANAGQAAERFRREAKLAASLDHPNIIPVYRVGQAGPLHFMAMKYVEGRAVDSIIEQQGALPIPVVIAILRYSAAGLAFAHERKVVHRDIKPANILVDKDGRVMVSDFGIARALEEVSMTASGMMIGTPYYMSPEQCGGQKVSPQSDQYSLGIMGFQMLTGEVPFLADSMVGVIQHHYMTPVPDILQVRAEVPRELLDVVYCSLNKDPHDRFSTTKDMATALENVPLNDNDREEAELLLKQLSAGKAIPKVRTGTLPPLALTISGPGPKVQPRPQTTPRPRTIAPTASIPKRKRRKRNKGLVAALGAMMALSLSGAGYLVNSQLKAADLKQRTDSIAQAQRDSIAAAATRGSKVIAGLPAGARVIINNNFYSNGEKFEAQAGVFQVTGTQTGYEDLNTHVIIEAGRHDTVMLAMSPRVVSAPQPTQPRPTSIVRAPADSGDVRIRTEPITAEVRWNNELLGTGTVSRKLPVGEQQFTLSVPGCSPKVVSVVILKNDTQILRPPETALVCR
ncbi:MAG: serine/threonine-protein kinase [Gemmatimonadaceae bacterium]